jgi:hypothetical protein
MFRFGIKNADGHLSVDGRTESSEDDLPTLTGFYRSERITEVQSQRRNGLDALGLSIDE